MSKDKQKILAAHVGFSLLIFITLFIMIRTFWFPGKLIDIDGGWTAIKLVAVVDIILGPTLTFFFIHPERASFKKDFGFIIAVQLIALLAGLWTVIDQRVAAVVFSGDRFYTISNGTLKKAKTVLKEKEQTILTYQSDTQNVFGMAYVKPMDKGQYITDIFNGYPELPVRLDRYYSLKDNWVAIRKYKITDTALLKKIRSFALMEGFELFKVELEVYKIKGRFLDAYILFDGGTKKFLRIIQDQ